MAKTAHQEITVANELVRQATALSVKNAKQVVYATDILTRANQILDFITHKEVERTKRLKEELAFITEPYIEPKKALKTIIADLRTKLSAYQTQAMQRSAVKAEVIARQVEREGMALEVAVQQLNALEVVAPTVAGESGSLSFRPKETLKIINVHQIPHTYMLPNEEMLLAALKKGMTIPGCEIEIIQVPINRRSLYHVKRPDSITPNKN